MRAKDAPVGGKVDVVVIVVGFVVGVALVIVGVWVTALVCVA